MAESRLSERLALIGSIPPTAGSTSTAGTSTIIDMRYFRRVLFVAEWGILQPSATIDFAVAGDSGTSMTGATVTGKSITQVSTSGNLSKIAMIEVTAAEVQAQGYRYLQATLTTATTPTPRSALIFATDLRYGPGENWDSTALVQQIVT